MSPKRGSTRKPSGKRQPAKVKPKVAARGAKQRAVTRAKAKPKVAARGAKQRAATRAKAPRRPPAAAGKRTAAKGKAPAGKRAAAKGKAPAGKRTAAAKGRAAARPAAAAAIAVAAGGQSLLLVNMVPRSLSDETNQDSEPTLAVNPLNPDHIVGTAFTPDPSGAPTAPFYLSTDGGKTWTLNSIIPSDRITMDICVGFGPSGKLYAGILHNPAPAGTQLNILMAPDYRGSQLMTVLVDRPGVDQPYVQAAPTAAGPDRLYVGDNDFGTPGAPSSQTSTIDYSLNAAVANSVFKKSRLDPRPNAGQNGPQVRPACHADGTVYLAYLGWRAMTGDWPANTLVVTADLVVVRDDNGGDGPAPFTALVDPADNLAGMRVVQGITFPFNHDEQGVPGQQRLGGDVAIAVDPTNSAVVYVTYAALDPTTGYTVHVRRSTDQGQTWSPDLLTLATTTNPSLAVNSAGKVGLLYQQLTGTSALQWVSTFSQSADGGATWTPLVLAETPADTPLAAFSPYLGDYACVLAVGADFYGIFSASNAPDLTNFPNGVVYQRNHDFNSRDLLGVDNSTKVPVSIDPFFFKLPG